jgi:RNA polymerase sigma-70 factor (ECF subfamily)
MGKILLTPRGSGYNVAGMSRERGMDLSVDDVVLAERAAAGDADAFNAIVVRYYRPVLTYLTYQVHSADIAEDILQDIFFRLWRNAVGIPVDGNLRLYLYRAARNGVLDYQRSERRAGQAMENYTLVRTIDADLMLTADNPLSTLERLELAQRVAQAIDNLPERAREVFLLHREQHLNYQEIAALLGITSNTVKFHIGRAVSAIKGAVGPFLGLLLFVRLP